MLFRSHEETKSYTWTTPRGAKIEAVVTVEHITRELIDADGHKIVANCNDWVRRVDRMTVNGKTTEMKELWKNERALEREGTELHHDRQARP